MTQEEIRLEAFSQAIGIAYTLQSGQIPTLQDILNIAAQIESFVIGGNTNVASNQTGAGGSTSTTTPGNPFLGGGIPIGIPGVPMVNSAKTRIVMELQDQMILDLFKNHNVDILTEIEQHLLQFHRVNYAANKTQDFNIVPFPGSTQAGEIRYDLQVSTRP